MYGAGETARRAVGFLGYNRIKAFAETEKGQNNQLLDKPIITYEEMLDVYRSSKDCVVVIAADKSYLDMEKRLLEDKVTRFITYHQGDEIEILNYLPKVEIYGKTIYRSYTEVLAQHRIENNKKIGIYGDNAFLKYLLLEVFFQTRDAEIYLIDNPYMDKFVTEGTIEKERMSGLDYIIVNIPHCEDDIRHEIKGYEIHTVIDMFDIDAQEPIYRYPNIEKYKNIHVGKRCFIVATGPSLTIDDLETLHKNNEICISVNKIYRCYDRTSWRADYVGVTDPVVVKDVIRDKECGMETPLRLFIGDNNIHFCLNKRTQGCEYFHLNCEDFEPNRPNFSSDMAEGAYRGCTVTYDFAIQMAAYMGFTKIYLVGVDHNFVGEASDSKNHFIHDYFTTSEKKERHFEEPHWDGATMAYQAAEQYSREHGFRIYNATRGGKLEVFERVDFDSLFA